MFNDNKIKIGFLENKLTPRGTSQNLYSYAHYNENILGNKSVIITRPYDLVKVVSPMDIVKDAYDMFEQRFEIIYYSNPNELENIVKSNNIDVLFIEKAGNRSDGLIVESCPTIVHSVFDNTDPHGTLFCPISDYLNEIHNTDFPVLPNIVRVYDTNENMRKMLNIPDDATVFGTYSGADCFNIPYVKEAVMKSESTYFIFMNINPFCKETEYIRFLSGTTDNKTKRMFINTCNAMLYGRDGGETFGIACGEFSVCNKPIICREEKSAHIHILGKEKVILHHNLEELMEILKNFPKKIVEDNKYKEYTPEKVMKIFKSYLERLK